MRLSISPLPKNRDDKTEETPLRDLILKDYITLLVSLLHQVESGATDETLRVIRIVLENYAHDESLHP